MPAPSHLPSLIQLAAPILLLLTSGSVTAGPVVTGVSVEEQPGVHATFIRVHLSEAAGTFSQPRVLPDGRLEVVLFNAGVSDGVRMPQPAGPVGSVRLEPFGRGHTALRLMLEEGALMSASVERLEGSPDLLVSVEFEPPASIAQLDAASESPPTDEKREAAESGERWRLDTIIIDAGHGGKDTGAAAYGVREKDVTLAVARQVGRMVEERLGCRVVYTRNDDRFVELRERGRIANREAGKLFVSIHVNAAPNGGGSGTETYFLGTHKSEAARSVMERENSVVEQESDPAHYEAFAANAPVMQALAQSAYLHKSEQLAALVEGEFGGHLGMKSRGVKQAGFYVLWSASMPSVLIELGFVTNPGEAAYLASGAGQSELAGAIFQAIRAFKEQYERDLTIAGS